MTSTLAGAKTPDEVNKGVQTLELAARQIQDKLAEDIKRTVVAGQTLVKVVKSDTESNSTTPTPTVPTTPLPPTVARHCGLIGTFTCGPNGTSMCAAADACPKQGSQPELDFS